MEQGEKETITAADVGEVRIVEAVGTAVGQMGQGKSDLAQQLEEAMSKAVLQALADGVSMDDVEEILRRKDAARLAVLDAYPG